MQSYKYSATGAIVARNPIITNVTWLAKINYICTYVSANYTKLYFADIFSCDCSILFLYTVEESPCSSSKHSVVLV